MPRAHQLVSVYITKLANKLSSARVTYADGAAATGTFPLSDEALFVPGATVAIKAGAGDDQRQLFAGAVIRRNPANARS